MTIITGEMGGRGGNENLGGDGTGGMTLPRSKKNRLITSEKISLNKEFINEKKSIWQFIPKLNRKKKSKGGVEKYADCFSQNFNTKDNKLEININKRNIY